MTIHPWTMYEVARYRDEERVLRAEAARRALRVKRDSDETRVVSADTRTSWLYRLTARVAAWAESHHLRPTHIR